MMPLNVPLIQRQGALLDRKESLNVLLTQRLLLAGAAPLLLCEVPVSAVCPWTGVLSEWSAVHLAEVGSVPPGRAGGGHRVHTLKRIIMMISISISIRFISPHDGCRWGIEVAQTVLAG